MIYKSKILVFQILFLCLAVTSAFADVTISGPSSTCIGTSNLVFTAEAKLLGGPQSGDFKWSVWRNGVMIYNDGANNCDPGSGSPSSVTKTLNVGTDPGLVQIRIKFVPYNFIGCDSWEDWHDVTVVAEPVGAISGALSCGSSLTRAFSIPTPVSGCSPMYHDWAVPAGWSVLPANGESYTSTSTGILTTATVVNVTSPSTTLATGYSGNYNVTVKRFYGAYSYYTQSTAQIWVGVPQFYTYTYDGQETPFTCEGLYQSFTGGEHVLNAVTVGTTSYPSFQLQTSSPYVHGTPVGYNYNISVNNKNQNFEFIVRAYATNGCGTTQSCTYFTNWATIMWADPHPNPANNTTRIGLGKEGESKQVSIFDSRLEEVFTTETTDNEIQITTSEFPEGMYVVRVTTKGKTTSRHLKVKH